MGGYDSPGSEPGEAEDPSNRINKAFVKEGKIVEFSVRMIPWDAFSREPFEEKIAKDRQEQRPPEKFHPLLRRWIAERPGDELELIMINFRDDLFLPRFPEPPADQSAYEQALRRSAELVQQIKDRRAGNYEKLRRELSENYKAEVLETFWLINAVLVQIPLGTVAELAGREDVLYIEPRYSGEAPPQDSDSNPDNDVQDGRALLASDPYSSLTSGRIGLLDSGVRFDHTLFDPPSNIGFRGDCVNGGPDCNTGSALNPNDDCWNHGTASAAIITANAKEGDEFRGVTGIILDSYKVYPSVVGTEHCTGLLDAQAAVWGFETAVARLDKVIVAEIQSDGSDLGMISSAADKAFDTGAVIIAANGNNGPTLNTVNAPANAHKVIGVGEIYVNQKQQQISRQSCGPAPDGRYKPDIQAPTGTETASNASNTALRIFEGTSGATPYAAGAAALLRNWLLQRDPNIDPVQGIDPGQIYAQLILSGQYPLPLTADHPFPFDNTLGAGPLRLTADGEAQWGKVSVGDGVTINITLTVTGTTYNTLDGAIWWPEAPPQASSTAGEIHNDIDLYLVDPGGVVRAESTSGPSVFERVHVTGTGAGFIPAGNWTLRIRGYKVPGGSQTVYWAAHVRL
jgi:serine protease AprX